MKMNLISQYHGKICDIANETSVVGEAILDERSIQNMPRSLPWWFAYKVTTIGEAKNIKTMKLEELVGSLKAFKMELEENKRETKKGITL